MEQIKVELRNLADEFEQNLAKISEPPETQASLDFLKRESVSIEGKIAEAEQRLLASIHQDDGIPSDKRQATLDTILGQVGVDLDQFRLRRRAAVNAANQAIAEAKKASLKERRARLLGDEGKLELQRAANLRNQTTGALASDITARLERTRDLIKSQVSESRHAIALVQESTEALKGVNDAAMKVETAQARARRSVMKLRWAQNWDRYLLKSSFWFFGLVVCYVVYRGLTRNIVVDLGRVGFKLAKKAYGKVASSGAQQVKPAVEPVKQREPDIRRVDHEPAKAEPVKQREPDIRRVDHEPAKAEPVKQREPDIRRVDHEPAKAAPEVDERAEL